MKIMTTTIITNEMLYELLKEFKEETRRNFDMVNKGFEQVDSRFEQVDKRFEQVDNRFKQIDKRLDQHDRRFDRIENQQNEDRKILMDLWHHKDNMELKLSKSLLAVTGILSGGISLTVSVLTNTFLKR
jgi:predicted nuclease with TOPRIM domain